MNNKIKDMPVTLFDNKFAECSLNAVIVNDVIYYMVERDGDIVNDFTDYNKALEAYIRVCFEKINK
jgi:hypothetical protein